MFGSFFFFHQNLFDYLLASKVGITDMSLIQVIIWSFILSVVLNGYLAIRNPGFIAVNKSDSDEILKLLINYDAAAICPDC